MRILALTREAARRHARQIVPLPNDSPPPTAAVDASDALDREHLGAVIHGDRRAIEALYRRHEARLTRFLRRQTARLDLVDDVVNDTFWVVWRRAADFRGSSKVSTWITGIAYRCMLKALRGGAPVEEVGVAQLSLPQAEAYAAASVEPDEAREVRDWIAAGLRSLPEEQRTTLELAYFMGQSCEDIAAIMNCPVGTVKARLFHARVRLRNVLPSLAGARAAG